MTTLGKLWTAGIAYIALGIGAGLSIMYNVLQTITIRGELLQIWDIVTAVAMPALVVLMVELFVSRQWIGREWYVQVLRWLVCLGVGGVAMRASWTHGHAWMLGHGHAPDVAIMWPLAIDLLSILATALILAGRRGQVATGQSVATGQPSPSLATARPVANGHRLASEPGDVAMLLADSSLGQQVWPEDMAAIWPDPVATQPLSPDGQRLATEVASFLATDAPVSPAPAGTRRNSGASAEGVALYRAWDPQAISLEDVDTLIMAYFGASKRTARRWRTIARGSAS